MGRNVSNSNLIKDILVGIVIACILLACLDYFQAPESPNGNGGNFNEALEDQVYVVELDDNSHDAAEEPQRPQVDIVELDDDDDALEEPQRPQLNIAEFDNDDPFILGHTLDPTNAEDRNYQSWGASGWLEWLKRRNGLIGPAKRSRSRSRKNQGQSLLTKSINTVVIATPMEIREAFSGDLVHYGGSVWSNRRFPTYIFHFGEVYLCPEWCYIAVLIDHSKPVHLSHTNTAVVIWGNNQFDYKNVCRKLS